jgi:hypothetical protein
MLTPTHYRVDADQDGLTLVLEDGTTHAEIRLNPNAARQLLLDANTKSHSFKHRFDMGLNAEPLSGRGGALMEVISAPPPPEHSPGGKIHLSELKRAAA